VKLKNWCPDIETFFVSQFLKYLLINLVKTMKKILPRLYFIRFITHLPVN